MAEVNLSRSPEKRKTRGWRRVLLLSLASLSLLCLAVVAALWASNLGLPAASPSPQQLTLGDKARLAEALHLKAALGDQVWPGFAAADIPVILFNEANALLTGYPDPPPGWRSRPDGERLGGEWLIEPGGDFYGQPYYRLALTSEADSPGNFTVLVGESWVASMTTKDWTEIGLRQQLSAAMSPGLRTLFPYRWFIPALVRGSDGHIALLLHETFHACAARLAQDKLLAAEEANRRLQDSYPWDDPVLQAGWQSELDLLAQALQAAWGGAPQAEVAALARQFIAQRDARRQSAGLSAALGDLERQREWVEGLARYAELGIWRAAWLDHAYSPLPETQHLADFQSYTGFERRWQEEIDQIRRMADDRGDGRFYYTGLAQALLLDRLLPGWKDLAMQDGVWLEELLRQALEQQ
jgi:hypothetical protein